MTQIQARKIIACLHTLRADVKTYGAQEVNDDNNEHFFQISNAIAALADKLAAFGLEESTDNGAYLEFKSELIAILLAQGTALHVLDRLAPAFYKVFAEAAHVCQGPAQLTPFDGALLDAVHFGRLLVASLRNHCSTEFCDYQWSLANDLIELNNFDWQFAQLAEAKFLISEVLFWQLEGIADRQESAEQIGALYVQLAWINLELSDDGDSRLAELNSCVKAIDDLCRFNEKLPVGFANLCAAYSLLSQCQSAFLRLRQKPSYISRNPYLKQARFDALIAHLTTARIAYTSKP